jgi:hypothetical protein
MKKLTILPVLLIVISTAGFANRKKAGKTSNFKIVARS